MTEEVMEFINFCANTKKGVISGSEKPGHRS